MKENTAKTKKNEKVTADAEALKQALAEGNKVRVQELLAAKSLGKVEEAEKEEVIGQILAFKDISLASYVMKSEKKLNSTWISDPENYKEKLFLQELLETYGSKIKIEDMDRDRILRLAVACNADHMVARIVKKPQASDYAVMAAGSEDVFELLRKTRAKNLSMEIKRDVAFAALMAPNGMDRVEVLENHGWDFNNQTLLEDVTAALAESKYTADRAGKLAKQEDEARLRFAQRRAAMTKEEIKAEDKNNPKERRMGVKELLTGKTPEKTYTQQQQEKKNAARVAREKKRRQTYRQ